jgi:preprotein translocase subunit SecB
MKDSVIQSQITLIAFKSVNFTYSVNNDANAKGFKPEFELSLGNLLINDSPNRFAKVFSVALAIPNPNFNEIININTEFHAVFQCAEKIDDVFLESDFAKISAPAIGFPYLRSFISNFSIQAGIAPIILPSINFVQFNLEAEKI